MTQGFLELCSRQGYGEFKEQFEKAMALAKSFLLDKKRLSGDSFFDHNIRVATILAETKAAPEVIIAGLLHGLLDHTTKEALEMDFGPEVASLVVEEESVKRIKSDNSQLNPEALRKILVTTLSDVRVVLIKLANKLDNIKTLGVLPEKEQKRIAEEVLEVYAPLANRLGADKIKSELEDVAFRVLNPKKCQEILKFLEESSDEREEQVRLLMGAIEPLTRGLGLVQIKGRKKNIYSIYKKMTWRKVKLNDQYDLLGVRVILSNEKDCYTLLGLLHERFEPIPGKLKDYIANPKANFYRSLHTAVWLPNNKRAEIQIRTQEMDEFAEEGIAAHWRYKGLKSDEFFEKKIAWLKNVLDMQKDSKEFLETAKIDVFGDKIHCYTPQGDVKEMPQGATILDFAYLVHEEIGNTAVGGRVNGKFVPIKHQLEKGDVVEIITNKNQRPRRSWIKIVKSGRARQKIRKSLREHEKLAPMYYRFFKPSIKEETDSLAESATFPKATCILAKCCHAIPGDAIVGLLTKRKVVSVHKADCRAALKEESRWVEVAWKETFSNKIQFSIRADERSGLLADLLHTIATARFEVKEAKAKLIDAGNALCTFTVVPRDLEHVKSLIARVQKVKGVQQVYFE